MLLAFSVLIKDKFFRPIKCERKMEEGKCSTSLFLLSLSLLRIYLIYKWPSSERKTLKVVTAHEGKDKRK
ncbi:hypothetical protein CRM71_03240 [Prevotella jejuni]|uniref:Uncharacterized protein n=1 Tax=Prevotella jejuni TaxID=1177574 RepID=A0A2K9H745_9BACT|nr:hypothetical protein CRM71_03240 [Prevotella jejuni]SNR97155.1 hypothetical protein SAMN06265364_12426 [Prevotella jejuni]